MCWCSPREPQHPREGIPFLWGRPPAPPGPLLWDAPPARGLGRQPEPVHPAATGRAACGAGDGPGSPHSISPQGSAQEAGDPPASACSRRPPALCAEWGTGGSPAQLCSVLTGRLVLGWGRLNHVKGGRENTGAPGVSLGWLRFPCLYIPLQPPLLASPQLGGDSGTGRMQVCGAEPGCPLSPGRLPAPSQQRAAHTPHPPSSPPRAPRPGPARSRPWASPVPAGLGRQTGSLTSGQTPVCITEPPAPPARPSPARGLCRV